MEKDNFDDLMKTAINSFIDASMERMGKMLVDEIVKNVDMMCAESKDLSTRKGLLYERIIKELEKQMSKDSGELKVTDG